MAHGVKAFLRRYDGPGQSAGLEERAAEAVLRGVPVREVAEVYGVHLRTAYRWKHDLVALETVRVDGWTATFARRRRKPPIRVSAWERVA